MRKALASLVLLAFVLLVLPLRLSLAYQVDAHFTTLGSNTTFTEDTVATATLPTPASSLALTYSTREGVEVEFALRYKQDGLWTSWETIHTDHDMTREEDFKRFSQIFFVPQIREIEIRVLTESPLTFEHLDVLSFEAREHIQLDIASPEARALQDGLIITRSEWGADDKYLFAEGWQKARDELCASKSWYCATSSSSEEAVKKKAEAVAKAFPEDVKIEERIPSVGGKELAWAVNKSASIKKLFVHHTAELNKDQNGDGSINRTDEEIALRGIYYYHSIVRGWGDIGYNFVVGPTGNIYEGRFGGDKVVAAHAVWRNISSIGVSALGNFETEKLSSPQKAGIAKILAYLSKKYGLNPTGTTLFYGKTTDTILGHRDSDEAATACPGKDLYSALPDIRSLTKDSMNGIDVTPTGPLGSVTNPKFTSSFTPLEKTPTFGPGETKSITISLLNTGTETWDTSTFLSIDKAPAGAFRVLSGDKNEGKAAYLTSVTPPGDRGEFTLTLQNRFAGFTGNLTLLPVAGGRYAMSAFTLPVSMQKGTVAFAEASATQTFSTYTFGEPIRGTVRLKNTGNVTWEKDGPASAYLEVATSGADGKLSPLPVRTLLPKDTPPGSYADIPFDVTAPLREGTFTMAFTLRISEESSLFGSPVRSTVAINHPGEHSRLALRFNESATPDLQSTIDASGTYVLFVTNAGTSTWENLSLLEPTLTVDNLGDAVIFERGVFDVRSLEPGKTTALRIPFSTAYVPRTLTGAMTLSIGTKPLMKSMIKSVTITDKNNRATLLTTSISDKTASTSLQVLNAGNVTWKPGKVSLLLGDTHRVMLEGEAIAPGSTASFAIPTARVTEAGVSVTLQLEGRQDSWNLGQVTKKIPGLIPLEFGRFLERYRIL